MGARTSNTFELVLFAVLFLGWFLRTVLGAKPKPGAPGRPVRPRRVPAPEPRPVPVDPSEAVREIEREQQRKKRERVAADVLPSELLERKTAEGHGLGSLEAAESASREAISKHRSRIRARLGAVGGRTDADAIRAGILWSEILGPPRSMRGPHRPPSALRA